MQGRHLLPLICCVALGLAFAPGEALGQKKDKAAIAEAKKAFKAGRGFMKDKKYGEAVVAFRKAYKITGDGLVMGQVAKAFEEAGDYEMALKSILIYRDSLPKRKQAGAQKMVMKYQALVKAGKSKPLAMPATAKPAETKPAETKPAETKPAETKPAETKPAETKPAETKPAETKPAETPPAETKPEETQPAEGEGEGEGEEEAAAEGEEDQKPKRFYTWIAAGSAAALALSGLVVGLNAQSKYDELMDRCAGVGNGCTDSEVDSVKTRALVADVLFGVAGAAAITAGVLYFLEGRSSDEEQSEKDTASLRRRVRVSPVAGQGTFGLSGTIKF